MLSPYDNWKTGFGIYEDDTHPPIDTELYMEERKYGNSYYNVRLDIVVEDSSFTFKVKEIEYLNDELGNHFINQEYLSPLFLGYISEDIAENYLDGLIEEAEGEMEG